MPENIHSVRRTLSPIIEARGREARRQVDYRLQHQLIGALTKRP